MPKVKKRQKIRKGIILFAFFLFPALFFYFSPVLIIRGALYGVINGSFIVFVSMFLSALVLGRAFCGWVCPGAGCQEAIIMAQDKKVHKGNWIKWAIWTPWISAIVILAIRGGGYRKVDFFYETAYGLSIFNVESFILYMSVVLLLMVLPAYTVGRRSFCHHLCWMAPFMILGRKVRNRFGWKSLQLAVDPDKCKKCQVCTEQCPMSLPVQDMVAENRIEHAECILCGTCVDVCKKQAIAFEFEKMRGDG